MLSRDFILKAKELHSTPCAMYIHGFAALCTAGACAWCRAGSHSPHWGNLKHLHLVFAKVICKLCIFKRGPRAGQCLSLPHRTFVVSGALQRKPPNSFGSRTVDSEDSCCAAFGGFQVSTHSANVHRLFLSLRHPGADRMTFVYPKAREFACEGHHVLLDHAVCHAHLAVMICVQVATGWPEIGLGAVSTPFDGDARASARRAEGLWREPLLPICLQP